MLWRPDGSLAVESNVKPSVKSAMLWRPGQAELSRAAWNPLSYMALGFDVQTIFNTLFLSRIWAHRKQRSVCCVQVCGTPSTCLVFPAASGHVYGRERYSTSFSLAVSIPTRAPIMSSVQSPPYSTPPLRSDLRPPWKERRKRSAIKTRVSIFHVVR